MFFATHKIFRWNIGLSIFSSPSFLPRFVSSQTESVIKMVSKDMYRGDDAIVDYVIVLS
ncbi:hypothetical protein [Ferruginibacter sp.]|nr:hypothetical protein [Ferruginibacter sp.]